MRIMESTYPTSSPSVRRRCSSDLGFLLEWGVEDHLQKGMRTWGILLEMAMSLEGTVDR